MRCSLKHNSERAWNVTVDFSEFRHFCNGSVYTPCNVLAACVPMHICMYVCIMYMYKKYTTPDELIYFVVSY